MEIKRINCTILILTILSMILAVLSLSGCSGGDLKGTITEDGSTTIYPVAQKLANSFMERHPNVVIKTDVGGSGVGIADVDAGKVDLGAASRDLKPTDPALNKYLLGHDGIAIVTHPSNPITKLSKDEIVKIFSGEITNWSQIGGKDSKIIVVTRETGSGTLQSFQDLVMGQTNLTPYAISEPSNGELRTYVSTNPEAISFLSVGYVDNTVDVVPVAGIAPTIENCKSGKYPFVRPLYFLTKSEAKGLVNEFIKFAQSKEGQNIVVDEGYLGIR